ncbi:PREDICTED: LOW QUALITY PROTEIN: uncharacterized protein C9orf173 homolog [Miniopterus natalensis]|uniref:LOW QUALITY PROTEIN: uncharacterized protein C9orf173 homolog n=1 Tax=Miniopterus natalensis TaxID=291302 RepID=UPI0007A6CFBE|nr:PREDICTED: LOW QUALITY PROTEIN: uncharacterized protein C9orf173 homolog [Miniopterus natalensis]
MTGPALAGPRSLRRGGLLQLALPHGARSAHPGRAETQAPRHRPVLLHLGPTGHSRPGQLSHGPDPPGGLPTPPSETGSPCWPSNHLGTPDPPSWPANPSVSRGRGPCPPRYRDAIGSSQLCRVPRCHPSP